MVAANNWNRRGIYLALILAIGVSIVGILYNYNDPAQQSSEQIPATSSTTTTTESETLNETNTFSLPGSVTLGVGDFAISEEQSLRIHFASYRHSSENERTMITVTSGTTTATMSDAVSKVTLNSGSGTVYVGLCEMGTSIEHATGYVRLWVTHNDNDFFTPPPNYEKDRAFCPESY